MVATAFLAMWRRHEVIQPQRCQVVTVRHDHVVDVGRDEFQSLADRAASAKRGLLERVVAHESRTLSRPGKCSLNLLTQVPAQEHHVGHALRDEPRRLPFDQWPSVHRDHGLGQFVRDRLETFAAASGD